MKQYCMQVQSKFRKLFWVRIGICFFILIGTLYICIKCILIDPQAYKSPFFIYAFIILLFFIYVSLEIFKIFKITVTDKGIEKTTLISNQRQFIPFETITGLKKEKIRMQTKSRELTEGYSVSIIKLENNKTLVISPDNFDNYEDIMFAIKSNLK